jgi:outer membrane protein TolC
MSLYWIVPTLALISAEDKPPSPPAPPNLPACRQPGITASANGSGPSSCVGKTLTFRATVCPESQETWPLTLRGAIGIALDNSEIARIIALGVMGVGGATSTGAENATREYSEGKPILIAGVNADDSFWRFQAEVMALVRSVEQQYWNLAQAHAQLWAADRAVSMGQAVLDRERADLMGGDRLGSDVAGAERRLEQFKRDLVARTAHVMTAERQLRHLLGLPPIDGRRIIPVTPPTEARLEPDWDSSLSEMLAHQPNIVQQRMLVRVAELGLLMARNQLLPILGLDALHDLQALGSEFDRPENLLSGVMVLKSVVKLATEQQKAASAVGGESPNRFLARQTGYTFQMPLCVGRYPLANSRQAQYALLRSRVHYQQVVHQTTHSLARFFLEIDANYKQFRTASRLRQAAAQRLDAQREYYDEGRITVDRYLDAIGQHATAVATEAQYRTAYNISIVALEEAKGTLLAHDGIAVADAPDTPKTPIVQRSGADLAKLAPIKSDRSLMTTAFADGPVNEKASATMSSSVPGAANTVQPTETRTWTFSFSIGRTKPLQITGTITCGDGAPASDHH